MHFQAKYAVDTLITFFVFPILHFVMRLTAIGRKKMHKLLCRRWISKLAANKKTHKVASACLVFYLDYINQDNKKPATSI